MSVYVHGINGCLRVLLAAFVEEAEGHCEIGVG